MKTSINREYFLYKVPTTSDVPTLNDDEQALCKGLITEREALNALKDFSANKSTGTDSLSVESFKIFLA